MPQSAGSVAREGDPVAIVEHSLRKWIHMNPQVLLRHLLVREGCRIHEKGRESRGIYVGTDNCSLCLAASESNDEHTVDCEQCYFKRALGHTCHKAYEYWTQSGDPGRMIEQLWHVRDACIHQVWWNE